MRAAAAARSARPCRLPAVADGQALLPVRRRAHDALNAFSVQLEDNEVYKDREIIYYSTNFLYHSRLNNKNIVMFRTFVPN